jgi:FkbM family methyltransferase
MLFSRKVVSKYLPVIVVFYLTMSMYVFTSAITRRHNHMQESEHSEALLVKSFYRSTTSSAPTTASTPAPTTTAVSPATPTPASKGSQEEIPGKLPIAFSRFGDRCQSMQVGMVANIIMADTATLDWVCTKRSERYVLQGMLHVLGTSHLLNKNPMTGYVEQRRKRPECHVLDVGANTGFYGLVGMAYGCDATFFDIQRTCVDMVNKSIALNSRFHSKGAVYRLGISESFDNTMSSQADDCNGQRSLIRQSANTRAETHANGIPTVPLTSVVPRDRTVLILKIDTEGHEYGVLKGALPLFRSHQVLNAFVEVTPCCGFWDKAGVTRAQVSEVFDAIVSYGYGMWVLGDAVRESKYYNADPVLLESADAIHDYILNTDFMQQDMWLYSQAASPRSSQFKFQRS